MEDRIGERELQCEESKVKIKQNYYEKSGVRWGKRGVGL